MVIGNSERRRTRSQSRQSLNPIIDDNNNDIEVSSIELENGTQICIGDIVGLQHNRLNTPFVVDNFNDGRVELMCIDGNVISLAAKHLTKFESIELNLNNAKHDSLSYFYQFMCRRDILDLLTAIQSPKSRLSFCQNLPQIMKNAARQEWDAMRKKTNNIIDVTDQLNDILLKFYFHLQREKIMLQDDEYQLIAEAIQQDKMEIPIILLKKREICIGEKKQNRNMNCQTCESAATKQISCIKCLKTFHSTKVCIPVGSLLLTKSQLICCSCALLTNNVSTKGWPAIVVSMGQVPHNIQDKNIKPDVLFVYLIGKNKYDKVKTADFVSSRRARSLPADFHFDSYVDITLSLRKSFDGRNSTMA